MLELYLYSQNASLGANKAPAKGGAGACREALHLFNFAIGFHLGKLLGLFVGQ